MLVTAGVTLWLEASLLVTLFASACDKRSRNNAFNKLNGYTLMRHFNCSIKEVKRDSDRCVKTIALLFFKVRVGGNATSCN